MDDDVGDPATIALGHLQKVNEILENGRLSPTGLVHIPEGDWIAIRHEIFRAERAIRNH